MMFFFVVMGGILLFVSLLFLSDWYATRRDSKSASSAPR